MTTTLSKPLRRLAPLALAGLLAGVALPASADFVQSGGGSYSGLPVYRALVFGGIDTQAGISPGYLSQDVLNGVDYVSNTTQMSVATGGGTRSAGGATLTGSGWSADSGFMASRNRASISVTNAQAGDDNYLVAGQGGTRHVHLQANAPAAAATFTWHVSGTASTSGLGRADARLDFGVTSSPGTDWINFLFGTGETAMTEFGPGTYTYTAALSGAEQDLFLYYWSSAYTLLAHDTFASGSAAQLTADFGSTYVLEDVRLFDASGSELTEWSMVDGASGERLFDQGGRVAAIAGVPRIDATVPEPASGLLLLAALVALGLARRPRRAQP